MDPVTLPSVGVDISGYVAAAVTSIGTLILAAIGSWFALKAFKVGMRWVGDLIVGEVSSGTAYSKMSPEMKDAYDNKWVYELQRNGEWDWENNRPSDDAIPF
jgi:hypothetical protein